jgi:hypothetical protein
LQPCGFTGPFVADLHSAGIVAKQAALKRLGRESDPAKARAQIANAMDGVDWWGPLPQLALWRATVAPNPGEILIGRPNVLTYRATPPIVSADQAPLRIQIDLAANATAVRWNNARDPFQARLEQGVADTVAEIVTISTDLRMSENTASVFSVASDSKADTRLFKPRAGGGIAELDLPPDTKARLAATVASGYVAVAPTSLVQLRDRRGLGWWRVDPASGETVGVMDSGYNGEAEDAELRAQLSAQHQKLLDIHLDQAARVNARGGLQTAADMQKLDYPLPPDLEAELELLRLTEQLHQRVAVYMQFLAG